MVGRIKITVGVGVGVSVVVAVGEGTTVDVLVEGGIRIAVCVCAAAAVWKTIVSIGRGAGFGAAGCTKPGISQPSITMSAIKKGISFFKENCIIAVSPKPYLVLKAILI